MPTVERDISIGGIGDVSIGEVADVSIGDLQVADA
jgi:hypothetical protein